MDFLIQLGSVIGVLIVLGGAVVLVKGSYNKARLQAVDEDNDRLRKRVQDIESELEHNRRVHEAEKNEWILERERLRADHRLVLAEVELLRALVTQRAEVEELMERLENHHAVAVEGMERIIQELRQWRESDNA